MPNSATIVDALAARSPQEGVPLSGEDDAEKWDNGYAAAQSAPPVGASPVPVDAHGNPDVAALQARLAQLEAYAPIADHLEQLGYNDPHEFMQAHEAQQQQHAQAAVYAQHEDAIRAYYEHQVETGQMTLQEAEAAAVREMELARREVLANHVLGQVQSAQHQHEIASAIAGHDTLQSLGDEGAHLVNFVSHATGAHPAQVAPALHSVLDQFRQNVIADHVARQGHSFGVPVPVSSANGAAPASTPSRDFNQSSWVDLLFPSARRI